MAKKQNRLAEFDDLCEIRPVVITDK